MVSKSIAITTTKNETKITPHTKNDQSLTLSRRKNNNPKNKDVKISTKIYRIGIENLQHLATPLKSIQDIIGILSAHPIGFLQAGHADRGTTIEEPLGIRVAHTLRKLPTIAPKAMPIIVL